MSSKCNVPGPLLPVSKGWTACCAGGTAPPALPQVAPGACEQFSIVALSGRDVENPHFALLRHEATRECRLSGSPLSVREEALSQLFGSWSKALAKFLMSENLTNCCCKHLGWLPRSLGSSAEGSKKGNIFPFLLLSCCLQNVRLLASVLTLATSQPQCLHSCWQRATGLTRFKNIFFFSPGHDFLCLPRRKRFVGNLWRYNSVTFHLRSGNASHLLHLKLLYSKIYEVLYRL